MPVFILINNSSQNKAEIILKFITSDSVLPVPDPIIFDENILTDPAFLYKARASFMQTPRQDYFYSIPSKRIWAQDRINFLFAIYSFCFKQ